MKKIKNFKTFLNESAGNYSSIQNLIDFLNKNNGFKKTKKRALKYNFFDLKKSKVEKMPAMTYGQLSNQQEITTYTADGKETTNIGNENDIVMSGPSKEKYIIKKEKLTKLYQGNIGEEIIPNQDIRFVAKMTPDIFDYFNLSHDNTNFKASWGEDMILKPEDYLVKSDDEYYRIAKKEYEETYNPIDSINVNTNEKN